MPDLHAERQIPKDLGAGIKGQGEEGEEEARKVCNKTCN
jgi:hypothetical protein